jgi:hypothetical protein
VEPLRIALSEARRRSSWGDGGNNQTNVNVRLFRIVTMNSPAQRIYVHIIYKKTACFSVFCMDPAAS